MIDSIHSNHKGVTLVELLAVFILMGIIASISIVFIGNLIDNTKEKADIATLYSLNEATRLLRISQMNAFDDVFEGYDSDEERMAYLYEEGFVSRMPVINNRTNTFLFMTELQQWVISAEDEIIFTPTAEIYFTTDSTYTYRITSYDPDGGLSVVVPQTINGVTVTELGSNSFLSLGLTSVVIQEGITRISGNAFKDNLLAGIVFPNSVLRIWHNAYNNNRLTSITFGSMLTRIEGGAFGNNQLTSIVLPPSVVYVGDGAFGYGGNYITSITIGSDVTIGNDSTFGWYGKAFRTLYNVDKLAGTYTYQGGAWTKQ
jgi:Tfp pilus assembly protein PilE